MPSKYCLYFNIKKSDRYQKISHSLYMYMISLVLKIKTVHLRFECVSQTLPKSTAKSRQPYGTYDDPLNAASVRT